MAWTTKNGLDATRTVHQKRDVGEAEGEMVSPPAFPKRRYLEIASLDGSRSISSTVPSGLLRARLETTTSHSMEAAWHSSLRWNRAQCFAQGSVGRNES